MIEESDGLIRTFDALLMIARAESGQARDNMTEFDAAEIVRGVGELYEPLAEENGLTLTVDAPEPSMINGNRELLSQALANLVDNAIKYARPAQNGEAAKRRAAARPPRKSRRPRSCWRCGSRATASCSPSPIADPASRRLIEGARSSVSCACEQSAPEPGSGLGLSLAAAVARLHGGELTLEDNEPGLKVVITLPRA